MFPWHSADFKVLVALTGIVHTTLITGIIIMYRWGTKKSQSPVGYSYDAPVRRRSASSGGTLVYANLEMIEKMSLEQMEGTSQSEIDALPKDLRSVFYKRRNDQRFEKRKSNADKNMDARSAATNAWKSKNKDKNSRV